MVFTTDDSHVIITHSSAPGRASLKSTTVGGHVSLAGWFSVEERAYDAFDRHGRLELGLFVFLESFCRAPVMRAIYLSNFTHHLHWRVIVNETSAGGSIVGIDASILNLKCQLVESRHPISCIRTPC